MRSLQQFLTIEPLAIALKTYCRVAGLYIFSSSRDVAKKEVAFLLEGRTYPQMSWHLWYIYVLYLCSISMFYIYGISMLYLWYIYAIYGISMYFPSKSMVCISIGTHSAKMYQAYWAWRCQYCTRCNSPRTKASCHLTIRFAKTYLENIVKLDLWFPKCRKKTKL